MKNYEEKCAIKVSLQRSQIVKF